MSSDQNLDFIFDLRIFFNWVVQPANTVIEKYMAQSLYIGL